MFLPQAKSQNILQQFIQFTNFFNWNAELTSFYEILIWFSLLFNNSVSFHFYWNHDIMFDFKKVSALNPYWLRVIQINCGWALCFTAFQAEYGAAIVSILLKMSVKFEKCYCRNSGIFRHIFFRLIVTNSAYERRGSDRSVRFIFFSRTHYLNVPWHCSDMCICFYYQK